MEGKNSNHMKKELSPKSHALALQNFCKDMKDSYFDKMALENYVYSLRITLINELKQIYGEQGHSRLNVIVSLVFLQNGRTRVKKFNSIFYHEKRTLLWSTRLQSWAEWIVPSFFSDVFHSGNIVVDNSKNNLLMIFISIPKKSLEIKQMKVETTLDLNGWTYYIIKLLPILVLVISTFVAIGISLIMGLLFSILLVKCMQKGNFNIYPSDYSTPGLLETDQASVPLTAPKLEDQSKRRQQAYEDID